MNHVLRSAEERRREIQLNADRMGIDDAYISDLIETFYARVRADETLGPIFNAEIGDNWGPHLARMKDFWASVAMNAGRYNGKPVPAHTKLTGVDPSDFQIWLGLFRQTLEDTAPNVEVVYYFMERAERIARSLQMAMFGLPTLPRA
ncbi:group III truncated hemoglobin [Hyphomonas johnsonii]|jgi:hemoglobin|uniref:Globin n=1 Tax=Hyphomonas johnsonii MHS-2 TaxID=1280950 RepID=A0A059FNV3_9PROT|nr:group III truncated hemoglobin [Hyphomonas johnsonii]KCZ92355.1 globin [Hyphomonas johnsonii MHS-2]